MSSKSRWASLFGLLTLVLCSSGFGQPPPPLTAEQIREIVKAAVDDAIKPVRDSLLGIETRVKTVEAGLGASGRAAVVAETEAAAVAEEVATDAQPPPAQPPAGAAPAVPPAAGEPAAVAGQIVPKEFWSVETTKKSGLYYAEPEWAGAIRLLKTAFKSAAEGIPPRPAEFNQRIYMDLQIKLFEDALVESGRRQENQIQAWKNFWELWMAAANASLTKPEVPVEQRRELFRQAFLEGITAMDDWLNQVETEHDKGTEGTTGRGSASDRTGSGSLGGYLPPLAAYHQAKHIRRMRRIESRIQAFRSY